MTDYNLIAECAKTLAGVEAFKKNERFKNARFSLYDLTNDVEIKLLAAPDILEQILSLIEASARAIMIREIAQKREPSDG